MVVVTIDWWLWTLRLATLVVAGAVVLAKAGVLRRETALGRRLAENNVVLALGYLGTAAAMLISVLVEARWGVLAGLLWQLGISLLVILTGLRVLLEMRRTFGGSWLALHEEIVWGFRHWRHSERPPMDEREGY